MTTVSTRSRKALASATGLAIVATLFGAATAHAAGPYDDLNIIDQGHADAFYIEKDDAGNPELMLHSDDFGTHTPEEFLIHGKPSVAERTAGALVANLLGINQGDPYYLLPQTNVPGQVFLGFGYNTSDYPANSINVTHTISEFDGPGELVMWQNSEDGPQQWIHTGNNDFDFTSLANHEHLNWGFTEQGTYTFDVTSSVDQSGQVSETDSKTYTFLIEEELPQDPDEEPTPADINVDIAGVAAHYHTGNVASLSATQSPDSGSTNYQWYTRASSSDSWSAVSGANKSTYGFVVASEQQVKVAVLDDEQNVIGESDAVDITIDDHGNTPVSGPELSVSRQDTQGALTISVAPDARHSQLSDLELNANADRFIAEGEVSGITVTDTRDDAPGWAASGRVRDFVSLEGNTISGKYLGWTPTVNSTSGAVQAKPGAAVTSELAGGTGIGAWNHLGTSAAGVSNGTAVLGADLRIEAPTDTKTGDYTGLMLITVI